MVDLDGNLVRGLALRQRHRVGAHLQVAGDAVDVAHRPGLVVDHHPRPAAGGVDAVEASTEVGGVQRQGEVALDLEDGRLPPGVRLRVAAKLLLAVLAELRLRSLGAVRRRPRRLPERRDLLGAGVATGEPHHRRGLEHPVHQLAVELLR